MKPACFFLFVHRHLEKWRSTLSSSASSEAVERGNLKERREGWEGKKKGSRDLSSPPIVHRALIYIFVIFILLEYPAGASKEERGCGQIEIYHSPSYINELLIEKNSSYNLHGKHSLSIPRVQSTKYGLHSFHYSVSKYWNMLPEVLRTAESLHVFK